LTSSHFLQVNNAQIESWSSQMHRFAQGDTDEIYFSFFEFYMIYYEFLKFKQFFEIIKSKKILENWKNHRTVHGPNPAKTSQWGHRLIRTRS
jgi:hypothetical protein